MDGFIMTSYLLYPGFRIQALCSMVLYNYFHLQWLNLQADKQSGIKSFPIKTLGTANQFQNA
jgi:hypothetical protein